MDGQEREYDHIKLGPVYVIPTEFLTERVEQTEELGHTKGIFIRYHNNLCRICASK